MMCCSPLKHSKNSVSKKKTEEKEKNKQMTHHLNRPWMAELCKIILLLLLLLPLLLDAFFSFICYARGWGRLVRVAYRRRPSSRSCTPAWDSRKLDRDSGTCTHGGGWWQRRQPTPPPMPSHLPCDGGDCASGWHFEPTHASRRRTGWTRRPGLLEPISSPCRPEESVRFKRSWSKRPKDKEYINWGSSDLQLSMTHPHLSTSASHQTTH